MPHLCWRPALHDSAFLICLPFFVVASWDLPLPSCHVSWYCPSRVVEVSWVKKPPQHSRRHSVTVGSLVSWLLQYSLNLKCRSYATDTSTGDGHIVVRYSLHSGQLWFSIMVSICCKEKSHWRGWGLHLSVSIKLKCWFNNVACGMVGLLKDPRLHQLWETDYLSSTRHDLLLTDWAFSSVAQLLFTAVTWVPPLCP